MKAIVAGLAITLSSAFCVFIPAILLAFTMLDRRLLKSTFRSRVFPYIASLCLCHVPSQLVTAFEVGPSILAGAPVYGSLVHATLGGVTIALHIGSSLYLFALNVIGLNRLLNRWVATIRSRRDAQAGTLLSIWIVSCSLGAFASFDRCHYGFSIPDLVFKCESYAASPFVHTFIFTSALIFSLTVIRTGYGYWKTGGHGKVDHYGPIDRREPPPGPNGSESESKSLINLWRRLLIRLLTLSAIQSASTIVPLVTPVPTWVGFFITMCTTLCNGSSLFLYLRFVTCLLRLKARLGRKSRQEKASQNADTVKPLDVTTLGQPVLQCSTSFSNWTARLMEYQLARKRLQSVPIVRVTPASPSMSLKNGDLT